jgi:hypothetical protein
MLNMPSKGKAVHQVLPPWMAFTSEILNEQIKVGHWEFPWWIPLSTEIPKERGK